MGKARTFQLLWLEAIALFTRNAALPLDNKCAICYSNLPYHILTYWGCSVAGLWLVGLLTFRQHVKADWVLRDALEKFVNSPYKNTNHFPLLQELMSGWAHVGNPSRVFECFALLKRFKYRPNSLCYAAAFESFRQLNAVRSTRASSVLFSQVPKCLVDVLVLGLD